MRCAGNVRSAATARQRLNFLCAGLRRTRLSDPARRRKHRRRGSVLPGDSLSEKEKVFADAGRWRRCRDRRSHPVETLIGFGSSWAGLSRTRRRLGPNRSAFLPRMLLPAAPRELVNPLVSPCRSNMGTCVACRGGVGHDRDGSGTERGQRSRLRGAKRMILRITSVRTAGCGKCDAGGQSVNARTRGSGLPCPLARQRFARGYFLAS